MVADLGGGRKGVGILKGVGSGFLRIAFLLIFYGLMGMGLFLSCFYYFSR